jgi:hypothetical protein
LCSFAEEVNKQFQYRLPLGPFVCVQAGSSRGLAARVKKYMNAYAVEETLSLSGGHNFFPDACDQFSLRSATQVAD